MSTPDRNTNREANPRLALQPAWVITTDSDGNIAQTLKLESNIAIGDRGRVGMLFRQAFISNGSISLGPREEVRDVAITGQWHPNQTLKFDGMFGISQTDAAVGNDGQPVGRASIPITRLQVHLTPGQMLQLDAGFERSLFDLSPQLVANRVVRNQFVVHPQLALPDGWRLRALAEMGPMTSTVEQSNARYNSEFTVGHKLGKASELYSTYGMLHYARGSDAGYFSPDLVQDLEGGWSTDIDSNALSLSLDFGMGAGRARDHGSDTFGTWGPSAHLGSFLTWTFREGRELNASYEYYYDASSPALEPSTSGAWHMSVVSLSFRWAAQ